MQGTSIITSKAQSHDDYSNTAHHHSLLGKKKQHLLSLLMLGTGPVTYLSIISEPAAAQGQVERQPTWLLPNREMSK